MGQAKLRKAEIAALKAAPYLAAMPDAPLEDIGRIMLTTPSGSAERRKAITDFMISQALLFGGAEAARQMKQIAEEATL